MSSNVTSLQSNFSTILEAHNKLSQDEYIDPEVLTKSRLNLIRAAKKSYEMRNSSDAIYWYGKCLATGDEAFPINLNEAIKYLNQAVMMRHDLANVALGDIYSGEIGMVLSFDNIIDLDKAIKHYKAASEKGNGYASFRLASLYSGELDYKKDIRQALDYIDKSVEQGSNDGLCLKAYWMYNGGLIEKDLDEVYNIIGDIIERSTREDFTSLDALGKILFLQGYLLSVGDGVEVDMNQAIEFMQEAAEFGDANAIEWIRNYNFENA